MKARKQTAAALTQCTIDARSSRSFLHYAMWDACREGVCGVAHRGIPLQHSGLSTGMERGTSHIPAQTTHTRMFASYIPRTSFYFVTIKGLRAPEEWHDFRAV